MGRKRGVLTCVVAVATATLALVGITSQNAGAAPVFVQQVSVLPQGSAASVSVLMSGAQAAGDVAVVVVGWSDATSTVGSVSDSKGNVYQLAAPVVRGAGVSQAVYYAPGIKAAAASSNRVSVSFSGSVPFPDVRALEYSGLDPAAPLDGAASGSGSSTSASSGSLVTSAPSDLLIGAGTTAMVFTAAGTGFTKRVITNPDGDIVEDRSVAAAGSYAATASVSPSGVWVMQVIALKAASGGTTTTTTTTTTTAPGGGGAPAFRQQASVLPAAGQTVSATYAGAQLAGDLNVVVVGWNDTTSAVGSVSDSAGNAYQVAAAVVRGAGMSQAVYYAPGIKAAGANSNRVSVSFSGSVPFPDVRILEYSGADTASPLDQASSGAGSSTSASSASLTTSTANELVVGGGTTAMVFTAAGAGFTKRVITNPDGDIAEDRVAATPGSYAATASVSPSGAWVMQAVAFLPAGGGGGTTTTSSSTTSSTSSTTTTTTTTGSDPRATTGQWAAPVNYGAAAGIMQHAILLPGTSKVLFFEDGAGTYVLDPNTAAIAAQLAANNLFCAGQTVLADGRVMTLGGDQNGEPAKGLTNTNVYDPQSNTWVQTAPMNYLRWYPTATKLPDGRILATSGTASNVVQQTPEVYSVGSNSWTALPSATNYIPSYPFMFVVPDGRLVQVGSFTAMTNVQVLDPSTWKWSVLDSTVTDAGSAVMYQPGKILRAGSYGFPGTAAQVSSAAAYTLDMTAANPKLQQTASMKNGRAFLQMTVLPDDNVLVTGGNKNHDTSNATNATYQAEEWSPTTRQWTTLASNQVPRYYHSTAVLLPDGRVILGGGWGGASGTGTRQHNYEIYSPPYLFRGARPTITSAPSSAGYGSQFTVTTPDAAGITSAALIAPAAVTHNFDENGRYVPLTISGGDAGSLQLTAPANGNIAPPGPYMLWIVNGNGVPSVASWITIH